jgi:hypothetical protein
MNYILAILFLVTGTAVFAQTKQQTTTGTPEKPLVQFSGIVYNADSAKSVVQYVSITNTSSNKTVYISNYQGYFSFVAHQQDTLRFSCVGYMPTTIVIPSADASMKSYTVQIMLHPQVINLPMAHVFPWATTDEFKKDFLAMKIADDDLEIAKKNINRTTLMALRSTLARDGQEIQDENYQYLNNSIMNQHSVTPNPLLNPLAWGSFINMISQGDRSRQETSGSGN